MALRLTFLTRVRFWAEVLSQRGEEVFVPTTTPAALGSSVPVEISFPDLKTPLLVSGIVLRHQPLEGRKPAGIVIKLDEASVKRCAIAGEATAPQKQSKHRVEDRVDCELSAEVTLPRFVAGCQMKSLSLTGATLKSPVEFPCGSAIGLSVQRPDGSTLKFSGEVLWARPELQLCGLRITVIEPKALDALKATIDSLVQGRPDSSLVSESAPAIVVADDEPTVLGFLATVISKEGYRVLRAQRGDDALELVRREKPLMVFLDVLMPGLDGFDVCRALRQEANFRETPIVLLSAIDEGRLGIAAKECGATGAIAKPVTVARLREMIALYMRRPTNGANNRA
jgi:CheY-like chemotaxis protein